MTVRKRTGVLLSSVRLTRALRSTGKHLHCLWTQRSCVFLSVTVHFTGACFARSSVDTASRMYDWTDNGVQLPRSFRSRHAESPTWLGTLRLWYFPTKFCPWRCPAPRQHPSSSLALTVNYECLIDGYAVRLCALRAGSINS